jgi:hypothetical protein
VQRALCSSVLQKGLSLPVKDIWLRQHRCVYLCQAGVWFLRHTRLQAYGILADLCSSAGRSRVCGPVRQSSMGQITMASRASDFLVET